MTKWLRIAIACLIVVPAWLIALVGVLFRWGYAGCDAAAHRIIDVADKVWRGR